MATLTEIAGLLLARVKALQEALAPELSRIQECCSKVTRATETVGESWSGSSFGYHSELYFRNFERPPLGAGFDPEWGGLNGIPAGWQKRSPDEVRARIEKLAEGSVEELQEDAASALDRAKALQSELLTELSVLHAKTGLEQEKRLLGDLETFKWGQTVNNI